MSIETATHRENYSDYTIDVTGSSKSTSKSTDTGITRINNQFLNRQKRETHQQEIMPNYGGSTDKCARCSKSVYLAEKRSAAGRSFHSRCFSCQTCNRKLDATILSEHKGEIYCKTCYTRQYGVHGLASGVTMTTENPVREIHSSRRSSYGSDLDAPIITHQPTRQRAHSNDNTLRGEHSAIRDDEVPKRFPWRNDILPDEDSMPTNTKDIETNHNVDKNFQRPTSQIGFRNTNGSTDIRGNDKAPHMNNISSIIDIPVILTPTQSDSIIERIVIPTLPTRNEQPIHNLLPTSTDVYRRQTSCEHQADIADNVARLTVHDNDDNINDQNYSNSYVTANFITSEISHSKQPYSHSSSYEGKSTKPNANIVYLEQSHSRDSSPSVTVNSNRPPSPLSGYASSSVHGDEVFRDSESPASTNIPQHDYLNIPPSASNVVERQVASSRQSERTSVLHEFAARTNLAIPPTAEKYSAISALVQPLRPLSQLKNQSDDDFNN